MRVIIIVFIILLLKLAEAKHASRKNRRRKEIEKKKKIEKEKLIKFWLECEHSSSRWIDLHFLQNHNSTHPDKCDHMREFYEKKKSECISSFYLAGLLIQPNKYSLYIQQCAN